MSEKTPRIKPHTTTMIELARKGMEMYHYEPLPALSPDQQRRLGQQSLLDNEAHGNQEANND